MARADGPAIRYVAPAPVGKDDGRDCTDSTAPCATIGRALGQAADFDVILVAEGIYTENLVITRAVTLEGGYETFGWSRSLERETTIDGNKSGPVVTVKSTLSDTTVVDGFTITNGEAGIATRLSLLSIQNCRIIHNDNPADGGGLGIDHSRVAIANTLIASNTARSDGAIRVTSRASISGPNSYVTINSSTIANNNGIAGRNGIFCSNSRCIVVNSIVWGHQGQDFSGLGYSATYSDIEMGLLGEGNISADPRFADAASGEYELRSGSPCVDAGSNKSAPEADLHGDRRPLDGDGDGTAVTDMGAYERRPPPPMPSDPFPPDGAAGVPINQVLSWRGISYDPDDYAIYSVALGTSTPPPVVGTTTRPQYAPTLVGGTTYYWSVTVSDRLGTTVGPMWRFGTANAEYLYLPLVMYNSR